MKIIAFGLTRTGTGSVHAALRLLGVDTVYKPDLRLEMAGDFSFLDRADAIVGQLVWAFPEAHARHPDAKFIHIVRDLDDWLDSCRARFGEIDAEKGPDRIVLARWAKCMASNYQEPTLRFVHRAHDMAVTDYFADKQDQYLRFNACGGDGWAPLSKFLGERPPLSRKFPHRNQRQGD